MGSTRRISRPVFWPSSVLPGNGFDEMPTTIALTRGRTIYWCLVGEIKDLLAQHEDSLRVQACLSILSGLALEG